MEDHVVKLVRPFEDLIILFAKVLEEERKIGKFMTHNEMMKSVMTNSGGLSNPVQVKEMVDKIFKERGL